MEKYVPTQLKRGIVFNEVFGKSRQRIIIKCILKIQYS
jgi:hypothetical protein